MKPNLRAMNDRIPNDIGNLVDVVYEFRGLDDKDLLNEGQNWYDPLVQMAEYTEGLDEGVAEKRVINQFTDSLLRYTDDGYQFSLDEDIDTVAYLSIVSVAAQYRTEEHEGGQLSLPLGGGPKYDY